jgi:cytochrome b6-f complex iron-sulfur subunit
MASQAEPLSRREFLYYVWAASMALFVGQGGGALLWFAVPRFRAGEFGGVFQLDPAAVPPPDTAPVSYDSGRFWLVTVGPQTAADPRRPEEGHTTQPGVLALYKVCVHLGCLYKWQPTSDRFECPCHASAYLKDGTRVRKPASRDLDRFVIRALDAEGRVLAETRSGDPNRDPAAGQPLPLPAGTAVLEVDTGARVSGRRSTGPGTIA